MDIKLEPDDELLSSNTPEKAYNGDSQLNKINQIWKEEHSLDIKYEPIDNQEEFNRHHESKTCLSKNDVKIKQEDDIEWRNYKSSFFEDMSPLKVEQFDGGECSYAEQTPEQFQTPNCNTTGHMTSSQSCPSLTSFLSEQHMISEILKKKTVAIIILEKKVFYDQNFVCSVCFNTFQSSNLLQLHVSGHKSKSTSNDKPKINNNPSEISKKCADTKIFECIECDIKFSHISSLKRHQISHTSDKILKCYLCQFSSVFPRQLKLHKVLHSGEKPFKCEECSYKCANLAHLKRHTLSHSGEKPFSCDRCDYKSSLAFNLKKHKMSHTGEKPFDCDVCDFKCADSSHLKRHKMSHTGDKPFKCDQCAYESTHASNLKTHKMSHTGDKPFKCDLCGLKCTFLSHLIRHKKSHTGGKPLDQ